MIDVPGSAGFDAAIDAADPASELAKTKEVYASYSIDNSTAIFPRPFENLTVVKDSSAQQIDLELRAFSQLGANGDVAALGFDDLTAQV